MHYDLVIIGATAAALGLARQAGESMKVLILNRTEMVVHEFVHAFRLPGVYSEGAGFYQAFRDLKADILLKTEVISITPADTGYALEIFNGAGFRQVTAGILVDTTTSGNETLYGKSLNCLLSSREEKDFPGLEAEGISFTADRDAHFSLMIMKMCFDTSIRLHEARHQLIEFWSNRPEALKSWKIVSVAFAFEETPVFGYKKMNTNHHQLISAWYDDPAAAEEAGAQLGRGLMA